jgi:hypothetical protein
MLNPPARMKVAYDSGVRNWFDPSLIRKLPVTMRPGDSLVSTISMPKNLVLHAQLRNRIERGVDDSSPIRTAAVLTCVGAPQPADAFFDYVDRWMYEDDAAFVRTIREATGRDHDKEWARQGQAWDAFVNEMWARHRAGVGMPPTDGWKRKHDDSYYRAAIEKSRR